MILPTLTPENASRELIQVFGGYNHTPRAADGEFYDMTNLTSDSYPVLSPRKRRGVYASPEGTQGLIAKDALCYVDGTKFVINGYPIDMGLSTQDDDCPKTLISMGAYVIILPDKMWINTLDLTDFGRIEASVGTMANVTFELCTADGTAYGDTAVSDTEPENPENLAYWIDTSSVPHSLKQYSESAATWISVGATYVRISSAGIGAPFGQYDGVTVSGILNEALSDLNGTSVIWAKGDDYIVVAGLIDAVAEQSADAGAVTVKREMPKMDYVTESENRLWGCRYGVASNGQIVNEIYASKLGDFKNWNCFMGISTDSYAVSLGSDGVFTGAATHLGYPLFFKENCIHKIYGDFPSSYRVQTTICRGVQRGCDKSLATVNEVLYYKARHAVCAYDGAFPAEVSTALGEESYENAVAGAHGNKYYISMQDRKDSAWHLFVYDTAKGMWHREDSLHADAFCCCGEELYCIEHESKKIIAMLGSGETDAEPVGWGAESGDLYSVYPDAKYISKLTVCMSLEIGSAVSFAVQYDMNGEWIGLGSVRGTSLRRFTIPVRPRRCDHLKLRITGKGAAKIYSITKTVEMGSDVT